MSIVNRKNRIFYLDFIRTFSLFCIMLFHFQLEAFMRTPDFSLSPFIGSSIGGINSGHLGSSLFLILSGATQSISDKSLRSWMQQRQTGRDITEWNDTFSLKRYYWKRFVAIFTAFYMVWILAMVGSALFMPEKLKGIQPWTVILTVVGLDGYLYELIPNFYMTGEWFLGCVVFLYLLYPLLRQGLVRCPVKMAALILVIWGIMLFLTVMIPGQIPSDHLFYLRLPEFMLGMYLAAYLKKVPLPLGIGSAVMAVCVLFFGALTPPFNVVSYAVFGGGVYIFLRMLGERWHWMDNRAGEMARRVIIFLAKISYSIFLLHHIILMLMMEKGFAGVQIDGVLEIGTFLIWLVVLVLAGTVLAKMSDVIGQICAGIFVKE